MQRFTTPYFKKLLLIATLLFTPLSLLADDCEQAMKEEQGTGHPIGEECKAPLATFTTTCVDGNQAKQGTLNDCTPRDPVDLTLSVPYLECEAGKALEQGTESCSLDRQTISLANTLESAYENLEVGEVVGSVSMPHLGDDSAVVEFSLSDNEYFEVNASGVIKLKKALDLNIATEHNLTLTVTNGAGVSRRVSLNIEVLKVAADSPKLVEPTYITEFTYSGDANWMEDNSTYHTPAGSWKNEDIGNSQRACMEASVDESEDTSMAFAYKISSEGSYDYLKFYIDGDEEIKYSGDISWTTTSYSITSGSHTLKWCYSKDSSSSSGDDTAWVDDIKVGEMHYTLAEDEALGAVGTIGIVPQDDAEVDSFTIDGNGSEKFEVATDGTLSLVEKLDYEMQREYTLHFTAHNGAGASNRVTRTITVTDVDDLYITNAFYDNNGTEADTTDDRLLLQYSKTLDVSSIQDPIAVNYNINEDGTIGTSSTAEYNATKTYYPHIITLVGSDTLKEQNISIADDTLTASGAETEDSTKTPIRATTGSKVLKKTGQIKSCGESGEKAYHQSIKDDGYYQSGVAPHYSRDDTKEVVIDHITGLEWQDDSEAKTVEKSWDDAQTHCSALSLDGGGWRLPTRKELVSLSDYGRTNPAINPTFNNVASDDYWSSTTYAGNSSYAWYVYFDDGFQSYYDKSNSRYVRCVRAGQ